jgi:aminoglycoside phosphotransferase (APT) family kinase protein
VKAGSPHNLSETGLDIENPDALVAYLHAQRIVAADDHPEIRVLRGGVSNKTVLVVSASRPPFVVKQALRKLRVAVDWYSDPGRIHTEARGLEWLHRIAPAGSITPLLFEDRDRNVIAMAAVPDPHRNWKTVLLGGDIEISHVEQFARLLGAIHRKSAEERVRAAEIFGDRSNFETLRLEPYYRYSAEQVPQAKAFLEDLIDDTLNTRLTVVHGDYSPKNILIHDGRLVLLDHEVIHFGDPAFDMGFSLTHLLSKAHHLVKHRSEFLAASHRYAAVYRDSLQGVDWRDSMEPRAVRHTLACLLARVAGRSPLEYLSPEERSTQQRVVKTLMPHPPRTLAAVIDAFSEGLSAGH